ncbi:MAG: hypothetical protein BroJett012_08530 [Betaproteobacteria bacterium]|nr:MAG: hypothetical protein BroJett012_08530 [Betaproteobacteria bacterium]
MMGGQLLAYDSHLALLFPECAGLTKKGLLHFRLPGASLNSSDMEPFNPYCRQVS